MLWSPYSKLSKFLTQKINVSLPPNEDAEWNIKFNKI